MATDTSTPVSPALFDPLLQVEVVPLGNATLGFRARGEVDVLTAPLLRNHLATNLRHRHGYVLNLTGVGFFGTAGLRLLSSWQRAVALLGSNAALVLTSRTVHKALAMLEFSEPLPLFATEDEAIEHVGALIGRAPATVAAQR